MNDQNSNKTNANEKDEQWAAYRAENKRRAQMFGDALFVRNPPDNPVAETILVGGLLLCALGNTMAIISGQIQNPHSGWIVLVTFAAVGILTWKLNLIPRYKDLNEQRKARARFAETPVHIRREQCEQGCCYDLILDEDYHPAPKYPGAN